MFDRDTTEALISHNVAAFHPGAIDGALDVGGVREAQVMICQDPLDRIARVAFG